MGEPPSYHTSHVAAECTRSCVSVPAGELEVCPAAQQQVVEKCATLSEAAAVRDAFRDGAEETPYVETGARPELEVSPAAGTLIGLPAPIPTLGR